jgi:hypothetical protein
VRQVVGSSSPDISAVAPAGVLEIEMFSVVPRVTDAQPTHGSANAAANSNLIMKFVPPAPAATFTQPKADGKSGHYGVFDIVNRAHSP